MRVREFAEGDTGQVLDLLRGAFGRWPPIEAVTPEEFFRWKFTQCPFGPAMVRVVELEGALAGVAAYMPWHFRDGEREVRALRGVDVAVDAAYRGRGVSMAIRSAARFEQDFEFVWSNPNAASHPGAVKAGRRTVTLPRFVGPGASLSTVAPAAARGVRRRSLPGASAAELLAETGDVETLLSSVSAADGRLSTARDLPYLRWRYGSFERYARSGSARRNAPASRSSVPAPTAGWCTSVS